MSKLLLFPLVYWLTGSPIVAIIVVLLVFYMLDRRFVGLTPSVVKPFKRASRIRRLREELRLNPHHTSNKLELARLLMERRRYDEAKQLLEQVLAVNEDSAEALCELGLCELKLGRQSAGESFILRSLELNPRVKYGEPLLRMAEALAASDPEKAVRYLEQFGDINSSSCEAYYRLGLINKSMGRTEEARRGFREAVELYRGLPKYKRRHERKWAWLSRFQGI